jgi:hypothetical protein
MNVIWIAEGYVSRSVADWAVFLVTVLLHDANKSQKNRSHINLFSLSI